jgi:hypothetical protein
MADNGTTLKAALEKFMSQHRHKSKLIQVNIIDQWPKIAGTTISSRTDRLWIKNRALHIVISSSVLKNELQYHKEKLVERVNNTVGIDHITDIIIH